MLGDRSPKGRFDGYRVRIRELSDRLIFSFEPETREAVRAELRIAIRDARLEREARNRASCSAEPDAARRAEAE